MKLNIAKDFSDVPIGRYPADSKFSGERFREKFLKPELEKLANGEKLIVDITDVEGYGSSFLEEAFGGLVRNRYFTSNELKEKLYIQSNEIYKMYEDLIWEYIKDGDN